jgi:RND family efflux transporter MFP subunit
LEYPGKVAATQELSLGFEVAGKITELPIEDGMEVDEGDVLGRLDPIDYKAARDSARSNLVAMKSAYIRAKNIFNEGAGSQAEVDLALRDYQVSQENLTKNQKALDDTTLKAPFSGKVAEKIAENYQNVQAKEAILVLLDDSSLEIDVNVPERDFVRMTPGLSHQERTERVKPFISVSSVPDRTFPAHLISFTTNADPVTRTYKATFAFENPGDVNILPGMTARVTLQLTQEVKEEVAGTGIMIPVVSVIADEAGTSYVWRVDPESMQVSRTQVKLGEMSGSDVQVLGGLSDGDQIAISGTAFLQEDMLVRPLEKKKANR